MIIKTRRLSSVAGLAVAGWMAIAAPASANGLFDFLGSVFGGRPAQPTFDDEPGLGVTVHAPSRKRSIRRSDAVRAKPVNTSIDPVEHPTWYLEDPTLRAGDIVVLPGRVLVYEGGRGPATQGDFTSLSRSRYVSKATRLKVSSMAGLPAAGLPAAGLPAAGLASQGAVRTATPERIAKTAAAIGAGE